MPVFFDAALSTLFFFLIQAIAAPKSDADAFLTTTLPTAACKPPLNEEGKPAAPRSMRLFLAGLKVFHCIATSHRQ